MPYPYERINHEYDLFVYKDICMSYRLISQK